MGWDFSTDPAYQEKLDWVAHFCATEVEPLEYVFPHAVRSKEPKIRSLVRGLQQQVKDQGCLLYTSPSPRDRTRSRMPSSA